MRKILLSSLSIFLLAQANAQITLTAATSTPQIGDDLTYKITAIDSLDFLHSSTGMNQTWDLSNLDDASTIEQEQSYTSTAGFTHESLFPTSNIGMTSVSLAGQDSESYFEATPTGFRNTGAYIDGGDVFEYTEGVHLLRFPMTLNSSYTDSIKGQTAVPAPGNMVFERKGVSTLTGDGYGDLILPYGTVHDVLRVKIEREYTDYAFGMAVFTTTEFSYYYYTNYNNNFIAATNHLSLMGTTMLSNLIYQTESSFYNLGEEHFTPNGEISLYPNPATGEFSIYNLEDNSTVEIVDLNGRVVKTVMNATANSIDISDLASGYYIVNIIGESNTIVKKLMVQ